MREAWGENAGPKTLALTKGLPVDVLEVNQDWSYVSFGGMRGFVPTAVLSTPDGDVLKLQAAKDAAAVPSLGLTATMALDYEAELAEGLSCSANAQVRVVQAGEEWTFCEYRGRKGFVPTALLRVSAESLLEHCRRTGLEVTPANYGTSDSSAGSESDVAKDRRLSSGRGAASPRVGGVSAPQTEAIQKDASIAIPSRVWQGLSEAEKHRQQMIYGIVHAEFVYNKNLWALSQIGRDFSVLNTTHPMLTSEERDALFRDVGALYALSNSVFSQLVRRVKSSENGVVESIADVIEANLPAFDAYVRYCSAERRSVQQQVFLEYRSLFGHPFHMFLERLGQQADLQLLVSKPVQHVSLWPFFVKNLLKDTSRTSAPLEYRTLRALQTAFAELTLRLKRGSGTVAADLQRRIVNYARLEPHLRGRRLLKESPAKIVSGSGVDLGNQAFLFDTCILFARSQDTGEKEVFRALKKVKLSGLRIADVQKATVVLRSEGDKYYLTLPSATTAIDWRNLISHKTYRERMDFSDADSEDPNFALAPQFLPEYDAHVARVQRMQEFIGSLLGPELPSIALSAAGPETLKLRAGASDHKKEGGVTTVRAVEASVPRAAPAAAAAAASPRRVAAAPTAAAKTAATPKKQKQSAGHAYTSSEEEEDKGKAAASLSPQKTPRSPKRAATREERSASQILRDAMNSTPARSRQSLRRSAEDDSIDDQEESSSVLSASESQRSVNNPSPLKAVAVPASRGAAPVAAARAVARTAEEEDDGEEMEDESEYTDASVSQEKVRSGGGTAPNTTPAVATPPVKGGTPVKAVAATPDEDEDSSDFVSTSEEKKQKTVGRSATSATAKEPAGPMPSAAYRTLTGQLDNIIAKSGAATRSHSRDESMEDEDEFETEASSEPRVVSAPARPTATPVARPTAAVYSHSPEESGNVSGNTSGKATARSRDTKSKAASEQDDEEESWEEEEYSVTDSR